MLGQCCCFNFWFLFFFNHVSNYFHLSCFRHWHQNVNSNRSLSLYNHFIEVMSFENIIEKRVANEIFLHVCMFFYIIWQKVLYRKRQDIDINNGTLVTKDTLQPTKRLICSRSTWNEKSCKWKSHTKLQLVRFWVQFVLGYLRWHYILFDKNTCYIISTRMKFDRCHRSQGVMKMEAFSALLALCAVNSPVTGEFPS